MKEKDGVSGEWTAGRELDAEIAEKVLGATWRSIGSEGGTVLRFPESWNLAWRRPSGSFEGLRNLPRYSTDTAAANEILLRFAGERYYICMELDADGVWHCQFGSHEERVSKSLPEAICLAALAVVPVESSSFGEPK